MLLLSMKKMNIPGRKAEGQRVAFLRHRAAMAAAKAQGADGGADVEQIIGSHQFSLQHGGGEAQVALLHAIADMFRTNAEPDPGLVAIARRQRMAQVAEPYLAVGAGQRQQVHRRRADKPGDEQVGRMGVEVLRPPDLLDVAAVHHHDAVGHRHCLGLVVGDVDGAGFQLLVEIHNAVAHFAAQARVEVGERLVHQEQPRVAHDGAGHRHPLTLAAGELRRLAVQQRFQLQHLRHFIDPRLPAGLIFFAHLHAEGDVVLYRQVREQGVVLEDHREVALARRQGGDVLVVQPDFPLAHRLQSGEQAQQGAFAAAGGADQHHKLAFVNIEGERVEGRFTVKTLTDVLQTKHED